MKKLLTVLCVAAFGLGAVAQAQFVQYDATTRSLPKEMKETRIEAFGMPSVDIAGQAKAPAPYDTLWWHDEYQSEDCSYGYYTTYYSQQGMFGEEVVPGVFSAWLSGTGEVGATYQTEENVYETYARIDVSNAWVVGAFVVAYRMGNTVGWERVGVDGFDPEHMNELNGVRVPDLPFKLVGYPHVAWQPAYENYRGMIYEGDEGDLIDIQMPLSYKDRVETTETLYLRYEPFTDDNGSVRARLYGLAGMFDHVFPARENFGLSFDAQLTGKARYDSLWNFSLGAKSNSECVFVDDWSVWQRWDFSNHDSAYVWLWSNTGGDLDVSKPWIVENEDDEGGLAPDGCPQTDEGSLFVYNSTLLKVGEGSHYMPGLYPIIQDRTSIERNQDAYAQTVSVYPLPATDKVTIVALDPIQKIEVYNMAGTLVEHVAMNDNMLELDVTSYVPGTYVAKITTENGVASKKLLVK